MLTYSNNWVQCDSKNDMATRLSCVDGKVFDESIEPESNTWGYLVVDESACIPIGFADVGLAPRLHIHGRTLVVGVSGMLSIYDKDAGDLITTYSMPTIFHDFVLFTGSEFIVQDEIGFVCLTYDGNERWTQLFDDIIEVYEFKDESIVGHTLEGTRFEFSIGEKFPSA